MGAPEDFLAAEHAALLRAAYLLTGHQAAAQDLVQETLIKIVLHWRRVERADVPQAYVRRILVTTFLARRRRGWLGEQPTAVPPPPADAAGSSPYDAVDDQDLLRRALLGLPPRQRAAVVLRHYEDRSEAETAHLLGCSVGTVKSLTSRGLATLRAGLTGKALT